MHAASAARAAANVTDGAGSFVNPGKYVYACMESCKIWLIM